MSEEIVSGEVLSGEGAFGAGRGTGVRLTDRDRDMLGLLVLARYLTAEQMHRLAFSGRHLSLAYRRLLLLSRGNGQPPFVRQRFFRDYNGTRLAAWAPTAHAMAAALSRSAPLPELPKHDVGAPFLEHLLQLNELFISLWRAGAKCPRASHPAFSWVPSDRVRLVWGEWEIREGRKQLRVIQPDAVLELPRQRRRYFLECEMGTHSITPRGGNHPGATLAKVDRYQRFLGDASGQAGPQAHYEAQYPDRFEPELLFLVMTAGRAAAVNAALASWRTEVGHRRANPMRAVTFAEAALELRQRAGLPALAERSPVAERGVAHTSARVNAEDVALLREYMRQSVVSIKAARAEFRRLGRSDLPNYPATYERTYALIERLAADSSASSSELLTSNF